MSAVCVKCGSDYGAHFAPDGGGCPSFLAQFFQTPWEVSDRNAPHIEIHAQGGICIAYMAAPTPTHRNAAEMIVRAVNSAHGSAPQRHDTKD